MTENQINKIRESIKRRRAGLFAGKDNSADLTIASARVTILAGLYLQIADYQGALTYKKWFDKNFPDDIGAPALSLCWAVAYFELGRIEDCKAYTIDTALKNVYLHGLMTGSPIERIDKYEFSNDEGIHFAESIAENCKKTATKNYIDWLAEFVNSSEYKEPVKEFIEKNKQALR